MNDYVPSLHPPENKSSRGYHCMKCCRHPVSDAVAICKACGRAVCPECVLASEHGIACRQSCADILSREKDILAKQVSHCMNLQRLNFFGSLFSFGIGILFMYFSAMGDGPVYDLIFLLGAGFAVYGFVVLLVNMVEFFQKRKKVQG